MGLMGPASRRPASPERRNQVKYQVRDTVLMLPQFGPGGVRLGCNRDVREGAVITDVDLEGVDVERLLAVGSIVCLGEDDSAEDEDIGSVELEQLTKAKLEDLADKAGLQINPAKMKKAEMIAAIRKHWDGQIEGVAVEADEVAEANSEAETASDPSFERTESQD